MLINVYNKIYATVRPLSTGSAVPAAGGFGKYFVSPGHIRLIVRDKGHYAIDYLFDAGRDIATPDADNLVLAAKEFAQPAGALP